MSAARGPHPADEVDFGPDSQARLRQAVAEVGWLQDRGYSSRAVGTLVGDHHQLTLRQRRAVMRCACGAIAASRRAARRVSPAAPVGAPLWIDGFNVLLTVEAALGGGLLLLGQDGCLRDMASMNGRLVGAPQTPAALDHIGEHLRPFEFTEVVWLFDRPVPHSGRLAAAVTAHGIDRGWPWRAETVTNPDPILKACDGLVATADGPILEASAWLNLARDVVEARIPQAAILDLGALAAGDFTGPAP